MVIIRELTQKYNDLFNNAIKSLENRLSVFVWKGFFEKLKFVSFENSNLTISSPSLFHKNWIKNHYLKELQKAIIDIFGNSIQFNLVVTEDSNKENTISEKLYKSKRVTNNYKKLITIKNKDNSDIIKLMQLNPMYTFDNFIFGQFNSAGFTAARKTAEQPGKIYNPLFIFGPTGVGKTHLMQAIGLHVLQNKPTTKILYITAEQWVNSFILSIKNKHFDNFRQIFRDNCDVLLIDDIQFLSNKNASQDEFFYMFNSLHQSCRQIVITSNKCPNEINDLSERLKNRFSWGLSVDINQPELKTRIKIIKKKSENLKINLSDDIMHYIANNIKTSTQELEGALLRLSVFMTEAKKEVSLSMIQECLSPILKRKINILDVEKICEHVAAYYNIKPSELKSKSRQKQITLARQIAMMLSRDMTSHSLSEIGRLFGNRNHSTVISSIKKINEMREIDLNMQAILSQFEKHLSNNY